MAESVFALFDEYRSRFAAGEWPEAGSYLARAGEAADDLALLIDAYLVRAEPPAAREDARALVDAWAQGDSPLLELRTRQGLARAGVVSFLLERFGFDAGKREKVARYYHELESGFLDAARLDRRLVD